MTNETARYGCLEIGTRCGGCGQPLPVNGPIRARTCGHCFEEAPIPADVVAHFVNHLADHYPGMADGEKRGGSLMASEGTYEYEYWRMAPECVGCGIQLPEVDDATLDGGVACTQCGVEVPVFPAPRWLREACPAAVQVIGGDREERVAAQHDPGDEARPVGMTCPLCGASLKISADDDRSTHCPYCEGDIHIPDAIWLRLHPAPAVRRWWLRFEGKSLRELDTERRDQDRADEEAFLARWEPWPRRALPESRMGRLKGALFGALGAVTAVKLDECAGLARQCAAAMAGLAHELGLEHRGTERGIGHIRGAVQGREVEIEPEADYAVAVALEHEPHPLFLKTEPPGRDHEELHRFDTGDERFDRLFPIRSARPDLHARIAEDGSPLTPVHWFLERWGDKLARMEIATEVMVHLAPGGTPAERGRQPRWIYADELEPLFRDVLVLVEALDRVAAGEEPGLPES